MLDQNSFWKHSANAAGFKLDQPFKYSGLRAAYEHYDGDFRRPQQGASGNKQSLFTEGNLFTGDYYLTGSFKYIRDNIKNAEDEYLLPGSLKQGENMLFMLAGKKNLTLSNEKDKRLLFGLELAYQSNLSGVYHYGGAHPDYPSVTELEQRHFNYLASNYFAAGLPVTYSQKIKEDSRQVFFSRLSAEYTGINSYQFEDRSIVSLSAGLNF